MTPEEPLRPAASSKPAALAASRADILHGPAITCDPAAADAYHSCLYRDAAGVAMSFYLYFPANYHPGRKYPLVLLLHGGGERADPAKSEAQNREKLLTDAYAEVWGPGLPGATGPRVQANWPSFVVLPQVSLPHRWVDVVPGQGSYTMADQPSDDLRMSKEIVDTLRGEYDSIDASRLYVTGMSIGGYGTWDAIERWPGYFAAAAPICGGGDPSKAGRLKHLPTWAFHSADDPIVPVSGSRDMIAAIRAAGGNPRYTEYSDAGHTSWARAYALDGGAAPNMDFYTWLFAQRNPEPPVVTRASAPRYES